MIIVTDTREQNPLTFRKVGDVEGVETATLKTGDYSIKGMEHLIAIERKSGADLYQTLGRGNKRFQKELRRAVNMDYFAILVETSFVSIREGTFDKARYGRKIKPDVILKILFTLSLKYGVHVLFCNDRKEASSLVRNIFVCYHRLKTKRNTYTLGDDLDMIRLVRRTKRRAGL